MTTEMTIHGGEALLHFTWADHNNRPHKLTISIDVLNDRTRSHQVSINGQAVVRVTANHDGSESLAYLSSGGYQDSLKRNMEALQRQIAQLIEGIPR